MNVYIHDISKVPSDDEEKIEVLYHVSVAGKPVLAVTAADDMSLVSDEEVQVELGYPFIVKAERSYFLWPFQFFVHLICVFDSLSQARSPRRSFKGEEHLDLHRDIPVDPLRGSAAHSLLDARFHKKETNSPSWDRQQTPSFRRRRARSPVEEEQGRGVTHLYQFQDAALESDHQKWDLEGQTQEFFQFQ